MVLGLVYLVRALFQFLTIPLVVSVDYFHLVESLEYFHLVHSVEYFHLVESFVSFDAQKTGKLNAVISTGTRAGGLVDHSKWLAFKHQIAEVTEGRGSKV